MALYIQCLYNAPQSPLAFEENKNTRVRGPVERQDEAQAFATKNENLFLMLLDGIFHTELFI